METLKFEYLEEEKEKHLLPIAILFSLIVHAIILLIIQFSDAFVIDLSSDNIDIPKEVTFVFPENKPKQIVENMNENELLPDFSDFLSEMNSRASNPNLLDETGKMPFSEGNVPLANLSKPFLNPAYTKTPSQRKFTKDALTGEYTDNILQANQHQEQLQNVQSPASEGTNNMLEQKQFSVDNVGDISLSTYAWDWAPYLNAFKKKYISNVYPPPAFYMGLIEGITVVKFTIDRQGNLLRHEVLGHQGHSSLEQTTVNAVISCFPFKPLPTHFPDETLTVTLRMSYIITRGSN
jgi:hypothetical protein